MLNLLFLVINASKHCIAGTVSLQYNLIHYRYLDREDHNIVFPAMASCQNGERWLHYKDQCDFPSRPGISSTTTVGWNITKILNSVSSIGSQLLNKCLHSGPIILIYQNEFLNNLTCIVLWCLKDELKRSSWRISYH